MTSIFRHGINNDDIGPIAKASFEETPEMFLRAAKHAELETMRGVSSNVMCGQEGYFGTGMFQILLDMDKVNQFTENNDTEWMEDKDDLIEKAFKLEDPNDPCSSSKLKVDNNNLAYKTFTTHADLREVLDLGGDNGYTLPF
jgi:DNA-directed RNA polymerase II subunit RPB1